MEQLKFPAGFLWGSSTSAYQVEGGIENCDWAKVFPAGRACDHYNLYEKDFNWLKKLNQNAYRFSLEWSRIEPEEGKFDEKEIEHYHKMIYSLKNKGVEPFVTLWHWTTPLWLAEKGGWESKEIVNYFSRYAEKIVSTFKNEVKFWLTINEPEIYTAQSYLKGAWPPQKTSCL
jgi:beta-glucosidase